MKLQSMFRNPMKGLVVLLGAIVVLSQSSPSGATCSPTQLCFCGANSQCFWSGSTSTGPAGSFTGWGHGFTASNWAGNRYTRPNPGSPTIMGDTVSYVYNRTADFLILYKNDHYSGDRFCVEPGERINLTQGTMVPDGGFDPWFIAQFNNRLSSHRYFYGRVCNGGNTPCYRCGQTSSSNRKLLFCGSSGWNQCFPVSGY